MLSFKEPPLLAFGRISTAPVRIDWLGDVITTSRRGTRSQVIKVACSKCELNTAREKEVAQGTASMPTAVAIHAQARRPGSKASALQ